MTPRSPSLPLLLLGGVAVGPHGLALVTPAVLAFLDPAAPVALAVFGVMAGLQLGAGSATRRLFVAAQGQALLTGLVVAAGVWLAGPAGILINSHPPWWMVTLVLALAAATSSTPSDVDATPRPLSVRLDVDDCVVPIVLGGAVLAMVRDPAPLATLSLVGQVAVIAMVIALSGSILLSDAAAQEDRVFTFGSLLLLGGSADYVSASALTAGLVAGGCWRHAGATVRAHVSRDVTYVQHSLVVLVLLVAGAWADFTPAAWALSVVYLVVRTAGKLLAGWLTTKVWSGIPDGERLRLIRPGIFGVAFALSVMRAGGPAFVPLLTAVVVGTIASSVIAALALREQAGS